MATVTAGMLDLATNKGCDGVTTSVTAQRSARIPPSQLSHGLQRYNEIILMVEKDRHVVAMAFAASWKTKTKAMLVRKVRPQLPESRVARASAFMPSRYQERATGRPCRARVDDESVVLASAGRPADVPRATEARPPAVACVRGR